jgi:hypothetical protein
MADRAHNFRATRRGGFEVTNSQSSLETEERKYQLSGDIKSTSLVLNSRCSQTSMMRFHFLIDNTGSFHQRQPFLYQENYHVNHVQIDRRSSHRWRRSKEGCC